MKAKYIKHYGKKRNEFKTLIMSQSKAFTISIDRSQTNDFKAIKEKLYGR